MMFDIFKIFRKDKELVEFPEEVEESRKVLVRVETLKDFVDTERIARLLKDGNIIFLRVAEIQQHDLGEFQNCVQKLRRTCSQFGWDIVGLEDGYLVLAPGFASIQR